MQFRFQTGSIKRQGITRIAPSCSSRFDSKLVRLKEKLSIFVLSLIFGFDSKLVRLKDNAGDSFPRITDKFRFQTGSIKSFTFHIKEYRKIRFRFQTGSIKRRLFHLYNDRDTCFDSKLVRLKAHFAIVLYHPSQVSIPNWFD